MKSDNYYINLKKELSIHLLQRIIDSLKDYAIFSTNQDGKVTHWNDGAVQVLGYQRDEVIGQYVGIFYTNEDNKNRVPEREMATALHKGTALNERFHVRKNGTLFWGSGLVYPLFDGDGNHLGFSKIMRNYIGTDVSKDLVTHDPEVSELRSILSFKELETSERRLNQAIASSNIAVWDLDQVTGKAITSPSHAQIYGYKHQEWASDLFFNCVVPEDRPRAIEALKTGWDTGNLNIQIRIKRLDNGELRWIQVAGEVVKEQGSGQKRMLGTTTDITYQKQIDQRKEELITIVSHELKTPLTSLRAYVQLLSRKMAAFGDAESEGMLTKMDIQIKRIVTMISDLLDVSNIESGHLQLREEEFDLSDLLNDVVSDVQKTTVTHNIILLNSPHVKVQGDSERLRQVIINLLTNAIKYSPNADKVIVDAHSSGNEVSISVRDFGVGIPYTKQKRIFERFYRVSEGNNFVGGVGMGLYISSEIVERLGGRMWLESVPNEGSTFSVSIPINRHIKG